MKYSFSEMYYNLDLDDIEKDGIAKEFCNILLGKNCDHPNLETILSSNEKDELCYITLMLSNIRNHLKKLLVSNDSLFNTISEIVNTK